MVKSKIGQKAFLTIVIITIITFPLIKILGNSSLVETITQTIQNRFKINKPDDYAYKIDNTFYVKDVDLIKEKNFLENWSNSQDSISNSQFIQKAVNQDLILIEALSDNILQENDFKEFMQIKIKNSIVEYYLKKKIERSSFNLSKVNSSPEEINNLYTQYKDTYLNLGFNESQIKTIIKNTIINEKKKKLIMDFQAKTIQHIKLKRKIEFKRNK